MRGLKEFFRVIVAAVICFGARLFGGNKKEMVWEENTLTKQNRNSEGKIQKTTETGNKNVLSYGSGCRPLLKKVMPWKQGPGDRNRELHKNKSPSRTVILEEIRDGRVYLVPE